MLRNKGPRIHNEILLCHDDHTGILSNYDLGSQIEALVCINWV